MVVVTCPLVQVKNRKFFASRSWDNLIVRFAERLDVSPYPKARVLGYLLFDGTLEALEREGIDKSMVSRLWFRAKLEDLKLGQEVDQRVVRPYKWIPVAGLTMGWLICLTNQLYRRVDVLLSDEDLYGCESIWYSSRRAVGLTGIITFLRAMFFQVILAQSNQYCGE